MSLGGQVALVTGASRGIGRGIALQLGAAGCTVYVTGRQPSQSDGKDVSDMPTLDKTADEITARGGKGIAVYCDHSKDDEIEALFKQINEEQDGRLDILVNNAYAAINLITSTVGQKFWEHDDPSYVWDTTNNVGLRNHYVCSAHAAKIMVKRQSGLIVNISSVGGLQYLFNTAYGVGKAGVDRMAVDMGHELQRENVCVVSVWPGAVRTEMIGKKVLESDSNEVMPGTKTNIKEIFEHGETTEFTGMCIARFASDPNRMSYSGRVLTSGDLALKYNLIDIDGRVVPSLRTLKYLMKNVPMGNLGWLADYIPEWVRVPAWVLTLYSSKF